MDLRRFPLAPVRSDLRAFGAAFAAGVDEAHRIEVARIKVSIERPGSKRYPLPVARPDTVMLYAEVKVNPYRFGTAGDEHYDGGTWAGYALVAADADGCINERLADWWGRELGARFWLEAALPKEEV